jgi:hypothetical protein
MLKSYANLQKFSEKSTVTAALTPRRQNANQKVEV